MTLEVRTVLSLERMWTVTGPGWGVLFIAFGGSGCTSVFTLWNSSEYTHICIRLCRYVIHQVKVYVKIMNIKIYLYLFETYNHRSIRPMKWVTTNLEHIDITVAILNIPARHTVQCCFYGYFRQSWQLSSSGSKMKLEHSWIWIQEQDPRPPVKSYLSSSLSSLPRATSHRVFSL